MAYSNNQCINCEVSSCKFHSSNGKCELESIKVAPRCGCHDGTCDESECASYQNK